MQDRNQQRQEEEESAEPNRELGQDSSRLGTEEIIREPSSEGGSEAFALWTLHEDREDHQETDDHENDYKKRHEEPHSRLIKPEELPL